MEELSEWRRSSIRDALEAYRHTVLEHNMSQLGVIVEQLEANGMDADTAVSEIKYEHFRQGDPEDFHTPRQLLTPEGSSALITRFDLNGGFVITIARGSTEKHISVRC
jgi:hemerythrin superfamily protein